VSTLHSRQGQRSLTYIAYFDDSGTLTAPDPALATPLRVHGFDFYTGESQSTPRYSIAHRHRKSSMKLLSTWNVPTQNRTLAVLESRVNEPFPYSRVASKYYGNVIFASHYHDSQVGALFGLAWNAPKPQFQEYRLPRIALVQANKFSSIVGENYSLRRKVIRDSLSKQIPLDIFGTGWRNSFIQNLSRAARSDVVRALESVACRSIQHSSRKRYRYLNTRRFGVIEPIADKFNLLGRYRFSLVIENDSDYISEKLRDSLACGCVTFYLGADVSLLDDLPGLIRLSSVPDEIVTTLSNTLTLDTRTFPDPQIIREAALSRFPHPSDLMWNELANMWLSRYSSAGV
jgi:hypothetical protein